MSKETVAGIGKAIEEAQKAKNIREEQEAARLRAEELRREAGDNAWTAKCEERLRATGVVDLFEELRDSGVLKHSEEPLFKQKGTLRTHFYERPVWVKIADYCPAIIGWGDHKTAIYIHFDKYRYYVNGPDGSTLPQDDCQTLKATISKNGELQINEHEMKPGEKLREVVRDEILRLKGLKE